MKGCESVTAPAILTVASWKSTTPMQASVASRLRASTAPCGRSSVRRPGIRESPYLTTMTPMKSMPIVVAIFRKRENPLPPGSSVRRSPVALSRETRVSSRRTSSRLR